MNHRVNKYLESKGKSNKIQINFFCFFLVSSLFYVWLNKYDYITK